MLRWFLLAVAVIGVACQPNVTPTPVAEPTTIPPTEAVAEVSAAGVTLSLDMPDGWQSVPNEHGILLAEHTNLYDSQSPDGILVYIFVQATVDFEIETPPDENPAYRLLSHVAGMPDASLHNATLSQTVPMELGAHEAAYYLLSDGHGNKTLVLALAPDGKPDKIIVCNVSASNHDAARIRAVLPMMLQNLTIDGQPVDMSGLDTLPDPLIFPEHRRERQPPEATREPGATSTPVR